MEESLTCLLLQRSMGMFGGVRRQRRVPVGDRACSLCREERARPGQWYCRGCSTAADKRSRMRRAAEVEALRARVRELEERLR